MDLVKPNSKLELAINKKKISLSGKDALVQIISMGDEDGLTVSQIAELLNTSTRNITKHLDKYAICSEPIVPNIRKKLAKHGVIPIKTPKVLFLPKDSIAALVKVINTDEAWAMYYQLWDDSKELLAAKEHISELQYQVQKFESQISFMAAEIESLKNPAPKKKRAYSNKIHVRTITKRDLFGGQEIDHIYETIPSHKMTPEQKKAYKTQHSAKTMEGIASSLADDTEELDGWLHSQAKKTHKDASRLKSGLLPPEGKHSAEEDRPKK